MCLYKLIPTPNMKKKIILIVIIIFIAIQFIRPEKNQSNEVYATDITSVYQTPENVSVILKKACRDCHSNNTIYPWYAQVQPVGWWLANHIEEGKGELNLSVFGTYPAARQYKKMEESIDQVKKGEMPIWSYSLIHTSAKLSDAEKLTLNNWFQSIRDTLKANYPPDSLILKRRPEE